MQVELKGTLIWFLTETGTHLYAGNSKATSVTLHFCLKCTKDVHGALICGSVYKFMNIWRTFSKTIAN